jgi:hypothetical protein
MGCVVARSIKEPERPPKPEQNLAPYPQVCDIAASHGWAIALGHGRRGWLLDVLDHEELIARGRSMQSPPGCFRQAATQVRLALERSGRLR